MMAGSRAATFDVTQHGKAPRDSHFVEVFQRDKHHFDHDLTQNSNLPFLQFQPNFRENMVLTVLTW